MTGKKGKPRCMHTGLRISSIGRQRTGKAKQRWQSPGHVPDVRSADVHLVPGPRSCCWQWPSPWHRCSTGRRSWPARRLHCPSTRTSRHTCKESDARVQGCKLERERGRVRAWECASEAILSKFVSTWIWRGMQSSSSPVPTNSGRERGGCGGGGGEGGWGE